MDVDVGEMVLRQWPRMRLGGWSETDKSTTIVLPLHDCVDRI